MVWYPQISHLKHQQRRCIHQKKEVHFYLRQLLSLICQQHRPSMNPGHKRKVMLLQNRKFQQIRMDILYHFLLINGWKHYYNILNYAYNNPQPLQSLQQNLIVFLIISRLIRNQSQPKLHDIICSMPLFSALLLLNQSILLKHPHGSN